MGALSGSAVNNYLTFYIFKVNAFLLMLTLFVSVRGIFQKVSLKAFASLIYTCKCNSLNMGKYNFQETLFLFHILEILIYY